jgi:peptide/nickel transport system substrate-binding protein
MNHLSKRSIKERNNMRKLRRVLPPLALAVAALGISACGSSSSSSTSSTGTSGSATKQGGTVTVLDVAGGIDSLDPGYWYYQTDFADLADTTQRQLYGWPPSATAPVPDLATALPVVSDGGKTLTITIRPGVKYSPPLQTRTVKAADIKYAMERCFDANVGNGYAGSYYGHIAGAPSTLPTTVPNISGIEATNDTTLTLKLTQPVGVLATGQALTLPCTTPIPQDYAAKYDKGSTPSYGQHQVFVGPYMIKGAGAGTVPPQGYTANKVLDLVRNPSWTKSTDFRPAYFNEIVIQEGYQPEDASTKILSGTSLLSGDFAAPPPDIAQKYLSSKASQFHVAPDQSIRYIAMNPHIKPLDNVNVRKAVIAVTDRNSLVLTRGGKYIGIPATHMIPPEMQGFTEAGGNTGPGNDYYASPTGNLALAESYMKKAGFPSGKYSGPALLAVGDNVAPGKQTAETFVQQIKQLGFNVTLTEVPHKTMYSKFCQVPKSQPAFCPNMAFGKDFFDSQSMTDPLLNGKNIASSGNSNTAQLNNPAINTALDAASQLTDANARAVAYANIDKLATAGAYYDNWIWDNSVNLSSSDVNAAYNKQNADWDLAFSSIK